jgi:hypothetical protein
VKGRPVAQAVGAFGDPADVVEARDIALARWWLRQYITARPAFFDQAACIGSELDFTSRSATEQSRAVQVCGTCPVMLQCRTWADEVGDTVAVLGGETAGARRARQALERKRERTA